MPAPKNIINVMCREAVFAAPFRPSRYQRDHVHFEIWNRHPALPAAIC